MRRENTHISRCKFFYGLAAVGYVIQIDRMKKYTLLLISILTTISIAAQTTTWFPYPVPPESLPMGRPRANYMVEHFWDRCKWKAVYSVPENMEGALRDFANLLPLAASDTVYASIEKLIKNTQKRPTDFAKLIKMAEATFNSDSATIYSDDVYFPFVNAAAKYKKFKPEERATYAKIAQIISSSSEGKTLPAIQAKGIDGSVVTLNDTSSCAKSYVVILENPSNASARFERVRFAANIAARRLIEAGLLKPILVATEEPDESWINATKSLPEQWTVAILPDASQYFDLRIAPAIYMLNEQMIVAAKWLPMNTLTANCEQLMRTLDRQQ